MRKLTTSGRLASFLSPFCVCFLLCRYKGVTPSLLKSAPSAAITFAVYSIALDYINGTTRPPV